MFSGKTWPKSERESRVRSWQNKPHRTKGESQPTSSHCHRTLFCSPRNLMAQDLVFKLHKEPLAVPFQVGKSDRDEGSLTTASQTQTKSSRLSRSADSGLGTIPRPLCSFILTTDSVRPSRERQAGP